MLVSAESQVPKLIIRDIMFDEFQRVWSQSTNVTDRQTDRQLIMAIPRYATLRAVIKLQLEWSLQPKYYVIITIPSPLSSPLPPPFSSLLTVLSRRRRIRIRARNYWRFSVLQVWQGSFEVDFCDCQFTCCLHSNGHTMFLSHQRRSQKFIWGGIKVLEEV